MNCEWRKAETVEEAGESAKMGIGEVAELIFMGACVASSSSSALATEGIGGRGGSGGPGGA